mmetsp:Transcript_41127/g.66149  ORF Transcript_41127/g.66149 Transcript_41127/m.66149 type:complete len:226 (-) Transcript_41127:1221-1898(-)
MCDLESYHPASSNVAARGIGAVLLIIAGVIRHLRSFVCFKGPRLLIDLVVRMQRDLDVGAAIARRLHESASEEARSAVYAFSAAANVLLPLLVALGDARHRRTAYPPSVVANAVLHLLILEIRTKLLTPLKSKLWGFVLENGISAVHEVLPNSGNIAHNGDIETPQMLLVPNAAEKQQLGRVDRPCGEHDFLLRECRALALRLLIPIESHVSYALCARTSGTGGC